MGEIDGKTVLIMGASKGIGAATARVFAEAGANVALAARSAGALEALAAEIGDRTLALSCDVSDPAAVAAAVDATVKRFGGLDVLINNASSFYPTPVGQIDETSWRDLMGSNLKAPTFLSQDAAPLLAKRRGTIVNMVDIHARRPLTAHPVYSAAKAGLAALTLSLARELAPEVRVNGIAPGPILWPESGGGAGEQAQILAETCLGRAGDPQDIVDCARYLINAQFVTGQIIAVDGGRSIGW